MKMFCFRWFVLGMSLCLCACSHLAPPSLLWKTMTGKTSVASSTNTSGKTVTPDIHRPGHVSAKTAPVPDRSGVPVMPESIATRTRLAQCQDELRALQGVDFLLWQKNRPVLDDVLSGASRYVVLRPRLSVDMQQVMDSVHQAHLARACQQIHADLFSALLKRADNP